MKEHHEPSSAPKVFVSHASEDKASHGEPMARRLRELGLDAWLDKWEIGPGDSLVDKIFEEGLKEASAILILLSPRSVTKPWVRAELDVSVVNHIQKRAKLIPIVVERCEVPQSLVSLYRIEALDAEGIDRAAEEVARSLFGFTEKPPIGQQPKYLAQIPFSIPGLSNIDVTVLDLLYKQSLVEGTAHFLQLADIEETASEIGITQEDLLESAEVLANGGYVQGDEYGVELLSIVPSVVLSLAQHYGQDVARRRREFVAAVLNEDQAGVWSIADALGFPRAVAEAIADEFEDQGLVKQIQPIGGEPCLYLPSPMSKRWLQSQ